MNKVKGSLTVFLSLILVFVSGLFFTLSEVTRYMSLKVQANRDSALSFESLFGEYNIPLWEDYGILGIDASYGKESFDIRNVERKLSSNMELNGMADGVNLLQEAPSKSKISEYSLLTDYHNSAFIKEAAIFTRTHVAESAIEEIQGLSNKYQNIFKGIIPEDSIENINSGKISDKEKDKIAQAEDPRECEEEFKKKDLLDAYIPEGRSISAKKISHTDLPSTRTLSTGNGQIEKPSAMDIILFKFYLFETYASYAHQKDHTGLQYEQEYLVFGKDNDRDNLKAMVNSLVEFRMVANNLSILQDEKKQKQAEVLATLLGFWSFNDGVIKGIKAAIIESWTFAESVRDVRSIMDGGKVPLLKKSSEWTTTIFTIPSSFASGAKAKKSLRGIGYDGYIQIMIFTKGKEILSSRALDLIEDSIRSTEHYENFRVDKLIVSMKADMNYQAKPLFLSYVLFLNGDIRMYDFPQKKEKSYLKYRLEPD